MSYLLFYTVTPAFIRQRFEAGESIGKNRAALFELADVTPEQRDLLLDTAWFKFNTDENEFTAFRFPVAADTLPEVLAAVAEQRERGRAYEAKQAEGQQRMAEWVDEHGSELVRERKRLGLNWQKLAGDEWFTQYLPAGFIQLPDPDEVLNHLAPDMGQISALNDVQNRCQLIPVKLIVQLRRYRYLPGRLAGLAPFSPPEPVMHFGGGKGGYYYHDVIQLIMTAPDGTEYQAEQIVPMQELPPQPLRGRRPRLDSKKPVATSRPQR